MLAQLPAITDLFLQKQQSIETWFKSQWRQVKPPFYASVDLRDSQLKLTSVDTNLFPAGFNNLFLDDQVFTSQAVKQAMYQWVPDCQRILIITENHTRNPYYLENVASLKIILEKAGFTVKISNFSQTVNHFKTQSGELIEWEVLERTEHYIHVGDFIPDCILLNNDLAEGLPKWFEDISQTTLPSVKMGWYHRSKSNYFKHYAQVCYQFAQSIGIDANRLNALFCYYSPVNFKEEKSRADLIVELEKLFISIEKQYQGYQYNQKPYVVIKADSGSYGMGVMSIHHANDLLHLSRGKKSHMLKTKGNRVIQSVILQEGIPTITQCNHSVAEPVLYLIGSEIIGGFYRTHPARSVQENLNAPGMELVPIKWQTLTDQNPWYAYGVVARLAVLGAAYEMQYVVK